MAKRYKYKLYKECDSTDKVRRQDIRKSLNSSERQYGKSVAASGLDEYESLIGGNIITHLRWNMEIELSEECYRKEITDPVREIQQILNKLNVGCFDLHKCTCHLPENLSDKEILKRAGY